MQKAKALFKNQCHLHKVHLLTSMTALLMSLNHSWLMTSLHKWKWHLHLRFLEDPKHRCVAFRFWDKQRQGTLLHKLTLLRNQCSIFQWFSSSRSQLTCNMTPSVLLPPTVTWKLIHQGRMLSSFVLVLLLQLPFRTLHLSGRLKGASSIQVTILHQTHHLCNHLFIVSRQCQMWLQQEISHWQLVPKFQP